MKNLHQKFQLFAVLALVMHVMVQMAPLWLPETAQDYIQICTTQGIKKVAVDKNGNEIPASNTIKQSNCTICTAQNFTSIDLPVFTAVLKPVSNGFTYFKTSSVLHDKSRKLQSARGPPVIS